MNFNKGNPDLIEQRRERVAYWRLRGKTQREIVQLLEEEKIINSDTNEPYSLGTINADCKALRALWKKEQAQAIDVAKGTVLAELREVRAAAWSGGGMNGVVKALLETLQEKGEGVEVRAEAAKALGKVGMIDYTAILNAIKQETQLLGLDAPTKSLNFNFDPNSLDGKSVEDLEKMKASIIASKQFSHALFT